MEGKLSEQSVLLIKILLTDGKISAKVLENATQKDKYKLCTIEKNGNVTLGKTFWRTWNRLINCQDVIPFESFALKVWDALVDMSRSYNKEAVLKGLSQEIVMKSVRDREYDWTVNRLFDCWRHVAQDSEGYQKLEALEGATTNNRGEHMVRIAKNEPTQITINVNGTEQVIPIVDSAGDTFSFAIDYGIRGLRRIF
jgi:hypothetical protein